MEQNLRLHPEPFYGISSGKKTSEVRLNDDKRQLMAIGDIIIFTSRETGSTIKTEITNIVHYKDFKNAYKNIESKSIYPLQDMKVEELVNYMRTFYTKKDELKYGVIDLQIKLID